MNEVLKAVREASISIACLLDDVAVKKDDVLNCELDLTKLQKDIEHIQNQVTIIENFLEPFTVAELEDIKNGSPEDRGSADRYYHRRYDPHWYPNGTGNRPRILKQDMSEEEIALYKKGWDGEQERKEW